MRTNIFKQSLKKTYYKQIKCKGLSVGLLFAGKGGRRTSQKKWLRRKECQTGMKKKFFKGYRDGSRGRVQGVCNPPSPPETTCGFLI